MRGTSVAVTSAGSRSSRLAPRRSSPLRSSLQRASGIRARVASAITDERKDRFAKAAAAYEEDLAALSRRRAEPTRSKDDQQRILRALIERAPAAASVHFHKFEEANSEELAEM